MFQRDFERNQGLNEIDLKLVNLKIDRVRCTVFIVYVFIILYITLFSREIGNEYIFKPLFWEYKKQMWRGLSELKRCGREYYVDSYYQC